MSIVERNGEVYKKPINPMDPENSNWDKPIEKRLTELECRLLNVETSLLELLQTIISKTSQPKEETATIDEIEEDEISKM